MKTISIIFLVLLLSLGCQKGQKTPGNSDAKKDSAALQSDKHGENSASINKKADSTINSGIQNLVYDTGKLPAGIKYNGNIVAGARWNDKNGENILLITETPEKQQSGDFRMKEFFGYHYIINDRETKLLWKINDFIKDCPVDITLRYIEGSLLITDLNNNGIAESSFLYRMSCKGDVSPDDMKLLMHENETKYAVRGQMKLTIKGEGTYGGEMKIDPSFDKAPEEFLEQAKQQWYKYYEETVGY